MERRSQAMKLTRTLAAIMLVSSLNAPVAAGPFEDAVAAYERDDYTTALRLLRPLAEKGVAAAQFILGVMYDNGHGVPRDYAEALKWYRLAANQGHARAQINLGVMYFKGEGVPQDYVQAHMWVSLAVAQGLPTSAKTRDIIAQCMTPAQIAEAQRLAQEWNRKKKR